VDDAVLNELLASDRPALAPRSAGLTSVLDEISAGPIRRHKRWRIGAVVSLGVILASGATAAIASPSVREWLGWTPDWTVKYESTTGETCVASFLIDYRQHYDGQTHSRDEVYALAVDVTRALDLSRSGIDHAVEDFRAEVQTNDQEWDDHFLDVAPTSLENLAVQQLMVDTLQAAFAENSIFVKAQSINIACDEATR
jgi:hypothetical protein